MSNDPADLGSQGFEPTQHRVVGQEADGSKTQTTRRRPAWRTWCAGWVCPATLRGAILAAVVGGVIVVGGDRQLTHVEQASDIPPVHVIIDAPAPTCRL